MGKAVIKPAIGSVLLVASFAVPGLSPLVASFLFSTGAAIVASEMADSLSDRQGALLSNPLLATAELYVVYGIQRIGIAFADARTHPTEEDFIYVVGVMAVASQGGGGIDDVLEVYFDERVAVDDPDVTGSLVTTNIQSPWSSSDRLRYAIHLGTDAQTTDAELAAQFATAWPASSDGIGLAYIVLKLKFDQEAYSGVPNITALVKGQKVFDPRSSTTVWSDNPALCIRDYLTSTKYGCAVPTTELDDQSFIDAANYCDELVNTTAVNQKRFLCNGALDTSQSKLDNLAELLSCCRGELIYQGGKFRLMIRKPTTATTFELTEDNIVGDWEVTRAGSGVPNSITARFVDPSWNYQAREVTWPEAGASNGFLTADNGHLSPTQIDLPFTGDFYTAQQIAMTTLREAREDITIAVTAKQEALKLQVGDVVRLTHSTPGFTDKLFWVAAIALLPDALVRLVLREYDVAAYTLDTQTTDPTPTGSELPNPFTVAAPTSLVLTANSTTALDTQGGEVVPRIKVDWAASTYPFVQRYEIEFKRTADAVWTPVPSTLPDETETFIWPVTDVTAYDIRVRAVNSIGVSSVWLTDDITTASKFGTPKVASVTAVWDEANDLLTVTVRGGQYITSITVDLDDNTSFSSPINLGSAALAENGVFVTAPSLATLGGATARNKEWFVRVNPFAGAAGTGTAGPPVVASTRIEGNLDKDYSIPGNAFVPAANVSETDFERTDDGGIKSITADTDLVFYAWVPVPRGVGVELTGLNMRAKAGGAAFQQYFTKLELIRHNLGGTTTVLATVTWGPLSAIETTTSVTSLSEVTTANNYMLRLTLHGDDPFTADQSTLVWARVEYTMPELAAAV